ncbi:putative RNA-binding protein EIF1AD [Orchesella cincta]|uniref:Probable RNA-binding protein EIF1AD n=1 Tax=Orchesella cincta TaxID=48709 RepID=A0A1D2MNZ5_ORCCI|nr:putative RNA-binding protein EIF1AD [Orchesella cincta]
MLMYIGLYLHCPFTCAVRSELIDLHFERMSLQKKNVIQEFIKDDLVPSANQFLVKYCTGRGNNLHEVMCVDGNMILVSMPKKYRQTVWLKRDDCLVIDPIEEGKKVTGEIVCLLSYDTVCNLIKTNQWPREDSTSNSNSGNQDVLLEFFSSNSNRRPNRGQFDTYPSSESSDAEAEENEDEEEENDDEEDEEENSQEENDTEECTKKDEKEDSTMIKNEQPEASFLVSSEDVDSLTRDRNKSRVQLVTSGIVTVTNIINEGLSDDIQSLEFEADEEDSSDELRISRDVQRHANAIRIQVNYNAIDKQESGN